MGTRRQVVVPFKTKMNLDLQQPLGKIVGIARNEE